MTSIIIKKFKKWKTKGTIAPSSKFLVNKLISKINFNQDLEILQLGFGNGVFARGILKRSTAKSKLVVFEIDQSCRRHKINDKRLVYIEDSAENITKHFNDKKFDHIISTLPFTTLPQKVSKNIFKEIKNHLKKQGKFLQFQYTLYSKKNISKMFNKEPNIDFELLNIPPAFIYETKNNSSSIRMNLKSTLIKKKMTLAQLAKKTSIPQSKLIVLKEGKVKVINFSTLNKICKVLKCTPGDLLKYENE